MVVRGLNTSYTVIFEGWAFTKIKPEVPYANMHRVNTPVWVWQTRSRRIVSDKQKRGLIVASLAKYELQKSCNNTFYFTFQYHSCSISKTKIMLKLMLSNHVPSLFYTIIFLSE